MHLNEFKYRILPQKNKLYRFALGILGNVAEAEDVVQEVFIKMWKQREEWNNYSNIEGWCMKMTKNLSIDKLRSKHKRTQSIDNQFDIKSSQQTPYQKAASKDTFKQIQMIMTQLPEKQRLVMQLRDIEGMTYNEIAAILELPMNQVKVNLHRARLRIRQQLINTELYGL